MGCLQGFLGLITGALAGVLWAWYIRHVASDNPFWAAIADGALLIPTLFLYQLWAWFDFNPIPLTGYLFGSIFGTYVIVAYNKKRRGNPHV